MNDATTPAQLLPQLCLLGVIVGVVGVLVPILPGLLLCWASVLVWALFADAGPGQTARGAGAEGRTDVRLSGRSRPAGLG